MVAPAASVTVTVYSFSTLYTCGFPDIVPVLRSMDNPVGNSGKIVYFNGAVPPDPLTGLKLSAVPWVDVRVAISTLADNGVATVPPVIVKLKDPEAV